MNLNDERLQGRLEVSDDWIRSSMRKQELLLGKINDQLVANNELIQSGSMVSSKLVESFDWIRRLGQDIKNMMQGIFMLASVTYNAISDIANRINGHPEWPISSGLLILEDSLGRIFPISLQFINSWDAFDAVMEVRFRHLQGHQMVQQKRYVLHESTANRDINRSFPWEAELRPGQQVVMCMLFSDYTTSRGCPSCLLVPEGTEDAEVHWWVAV